MSADKDKQSYADFFFSMLKESMVHELPYQAVLPWIVDGRGFRLTIEPIEMPAALRPEEDGQLALGQDAAASPPFPPTGTDQSSS
jgi:hypothetical protein